MKLFLILRKLIARIKRVLKDRHGTTDPDIIPDVLCGALTMQSIVIGGVIYLVRSHFREDTTTTALDKINRLIDKDAESSQ